VDSDPGKPKWPSLSLATSTMFPGSDPDSIKFGYAKLTESSKLGVHIATDKKNKEKRNTMNNKANLRPQLINKCK
jgi:hypothetical protein